MDPLRLNVNLTTTFMLPMLEGLKHTDILTDSFKNTYIADIDRPEKDSSLLINYATITDLPDWVSDPIAYTAEDESIMVTANIPDSVADEYSKFLVGDYSKFSDDYKNRIMEFWEADKYTLLHGVLYREGKEIEKFWEESFEVDLDITPSEMEYWKPPSLKQEIFGMTGD